MLSTVQARGTEFKQADTGSNMFTKKARHTTTITNRQTAMTVWKLEKLILRCHYRPDASICESPVVEPTHIFHLYTN